MVKLEPNRRFGPIGRGRRSPTSRSPKRLRTSLKKTDRRSQIRRAVTGKVIGKNPERNVGAHNNKIRESPPERRRWRVKMCSSKDERRSSRTRALGARHRNVRERRRSRTRDSKAIGKRDSSASVERRSRTFVAAKARPKAAVVVRCEVHAKAMPKAAKAVPKDVLDARSIVVSCGINNCVDSNYSNKRCREFSKWQKRTYGKVVKAKVVKEKRQEEANAIEGREENDPPEKELTETKAAIRQPASEVLELSLIHI